MPTSILVCVCVGGGAGIEKMYIHACMYTHMNVHIKHMYMLLNDHTPMHARIHTHMYACWMHNLP